MISAIQLQAALGCSIERAAQWVDAINTAMDEFGIDTPKRIAAFLAQVGHESGRLRYTKEMWGATPAQLRYEGRIDLGNLLPGDGHKFLGRGLIQITGRDNYKTCGSALGIDLESHPEMLERCDIAARSAAWFWKNHGCNQFADDGLFLQLTKRINGGTNGYADRLALLASATAALA